MCQHSAGPDPLAVGRSANHHLATAIDLYALVKRANRKVRGPTFIAIHELFDKGAGDACDTI